MIDGTFLSAIETLNVKLGREERVIKVNNSTNNQNVKNVLVELFIIFHLKRKFLHQSRSYDEITFVIRHNGV